MENNLQQRIDSAYKKIKAIYKKKGLLHSFYTFYRFRTCPIKKIFSLIPEGNHYIDVGCGYGFISLWTALVFPNANVLGMDVVHSRMDFANSLTDGIDNLSFEQKDITKDAIDGSEIILLIDLFHHIPFDNQLPFLQQCIDKTPENGWIIFKDIDTKPWWKFRVNYIQDYLFTREKTFCRNKDEYMALFKKNGLNAQYIDFKKGYAYSHYLIRAQKSAGK
ncbi:MAG: class I SAM-dependent methyltransferase [bacterium]|nr:class I SAM-dependent methyltransferase [bacterium]